MSPRGHQPHAVLRLEEATVVVATKVFDAPEGKRSASEERKEAELRRLKDVVAEITAENLELKKGLSG